MDAGPEPQDKPKLNRETVSIVPQHIQIMAIVQI